MNVGVLKIDNGECIPRHASADVNRIAYELCKHGYFVTHALNVSQSEEVYDAFDFLIRHTDAVLVCGHTDAFYTAVAGKYEIGESLSTLLLNDTPCAISNTCDDSFIRDTLIPMLNSRCKTFYASAVFKTVGKSEDELRLLLKDYVKNRNKIVFTFVPEPPECTVLIRYSNKMQKSTVQDMLGGVANLLKDCVYAYEEISLPQKVAQMLLARHKTVALAESFTGGNIAAALVAYPGISAAFKESLVCYDSLVKQKRLHVLQNVLQNHGAVSDETAYEMAANLITQGNYDYVIATTGNAGPTSEKPNETGKCFIAVGNRTTVDIYPCQWEGDRADIIHHGTVTALFYLYKLLSGEESARTEETSQKTQGV